MTATVLGILTVILAAIGIYYMAKSNAREAARLKQADRDALLAPKDAVIADQKQTIRDQAQRITELEDELRRSR